MNFMTELSISALPIRLTYDGSVNSRVSTTLMMGRLETFGNLL